MRFPEGSGPLVLGIETSCDETAAAVVAGGTEMLSNVVASQVDIHAIFGGVVPEVASRKHVELIVPVLEGALKEAGVSYGDLDAVAVTYGPGLEGSLLVGMAVAKALCLAHDLPLVAVNHLEGHIYANVLARPDCFDEFPLVALIVSGGHTDLVLMRGHGDYQLLGHTLDDAAGEAFDKVARALGLGFPGGPKIEALAKRGDPEAVRLPRAELPSTYNFSFSGLKTAVVRILKGMDKRYPKGARPEDIAAGFQESVADILTRKTVKAAKEFGVRRVLLSGGVAANSALREHMQRACREEGLELFVPPPPLCTDNAAMIAACACFKFERGETAPLDIDIEAEARLGGG